MKLSDLVTLERGHSSWFRYPTHNIGTYLGRGVRGMWGMKGMRGIRGMRGMRAEGAEGVEGAWLYGAPEQKV